MRTKKPKRLGHRHHFNVKNISLTDSQINEVVDTLENLLACSRFLYWVTEYDKQEAKDGDKSVSIAFEKAARVLERCGLPYDSTEGYLKRFEAMLEESPEEFWQKKKERDEWLRKRAELRRQDKRDEEA